MAYTSNTPQANQRISDTQPLILNNFLDLDTWSTVNHYGFNSGANRGKHTVVTLPEQPADPGTVGNEMALYTKQSTLSGVAEMFIQREAGGTVYEFTSSLANQNGWTRLPSGILLKWGFGAANGNTVILFPVAATIPVFSNIFTAQITTFDATGADPDEFSFLTALSTTSLTVFGAQRTMVGARATNFYYLAIGN